MDLLSNAIESIRTGVEDFEDGSHGRLLAAVGSIHAGILLLYKEALRRVSPASSNEVLVKAKIVPRRSQAGGIEFVGEGKKAADVQQIKERFAGLGIATDWARFDQITNVRNDVEHYYSKANKKSLESVVSNAFVIARNFLATELKEDPRQLLGDDAWNAMLQVSEVYEAERAECVKALEALDWESRALAKGVLDLTCPACSGSLLRPEDGVDSYRDSMSLECRACGESYDAQKFVPDAVASALAFDKYEMLKEGGEEPFVPCPECGAETYVVDEWRCAQCGHEAERTCARCGNAIPPEELLCSPYCGWCEHMMAKDD